ncbi:hypothetical protein Nepgr_001589 [Nepenthes gracilis]|uniref:Uncharacterized protein n=1 Tax=Nepenthes gracilis TaxID=150966 RepID=A0AAD3RXU8_NEPGR|nr:hypothetical protein Nepgr_001589 [Nepenthes gracilis]
MNGPTVDPPPDGSKSHNPVQLPSDESAFAPLHNDGNSLAQPSRNDPSQGEDQPGADQARVDLRPERICALECLCVRLERRNASRPGELVQVD